MIIDLRSDTVTLPGKDMLNSITHANVGDNVFGEDPTANELEEYGAKLFGKEAALWCPSGTMTNQIAINVHTQPGDEVICEFNAHIYQYEGGGIGANSGASVRYLHGEKGCFNVEELKKHVHNPVHDYLANSKLVNIENTNNRAGGTIWESTEIKEISEYCRSNNLKIHLDGARIFNALVETNETPKAHGKLFDSISICLSKGLGAPMGSLLIGTKDFIKASRRVQKRIGGTTRQVGFMAAAGLYGLKNNITRLKEDHNRAKEIESILNSCNYVNEVYPVETNIIVFKLSHGVDEKKFLKKLESNGVLAISMGGGLLRMVTHLDINETKMQRITNILEKLKI